MNVKFYAKLLAVFFFLLFSIHLFAQRKTITGKVTDQETGQPLQGVTVNLKGTNTNVVSGADGSFSIPNASAGSVLLVSYIGYTSQELPAGEGSVNIAMSNTVKKLDEVVVIGYGQVRKRDLTGSVSSVKGEEITKVPVTTINEALQGKIPGADITRANGYAGQGASVRVRGTRSISNPASSNNVLYIVDGVQGVTASDIDPNDVQSIEVLKDASSTAIYGSRGANGVVIITTKRGTGGKPRLNFNTYAGVSEVAGYGEFMNGPQYIAFRREAYRAAGLWNSVADDPAAFGNNVRTLNAIKNQQYVNWPDLLLHNGFQQNYQMGVAGGSDKTKVYFSGGYFDEKGLMKQDRYKRYSSRLNIDQTINSWVKTGMQAQFAYIDNDIRRDPFAQASKTPPLGSPYDSLGNFVYLPLGETTQINPLADEQPGGFYRNQKTTNFSGAAYLELTPIKGLTIRSSLATTFSNLVNGQFYSKNTIDGKGTTTQTSINNSQTRFLSWENVATYNKTIQDHAFTVTGVTTYNSTVGTTSAATGQGQVFPSQLFYNIGNATINPGSPRSSSYGAFNLISFAGRLNYSYKERYLLTFTGRTDGSSKLGEGNKWAFFPAAAAAWRINDESFMKNQKLFSDLKVRASFGISGNDVIGAYATQNLLTSVAFSYDDANAANAYLLNQTIGNEALKWELTTTKDIGIDFGLWNNLITGTVDYYQARTNDLIFSYTLPLSTGVTSVNRNIGETGNKGIEVSLTSNNIRKKNFTWSTTAIFYANREKIISLPNGNVYASDYRNSLIIGQSPTVYYDWVKLGIWQKGEETQAAVYGAIPGDIKLKDISGPDGKPDGKLTEQYDRAVIGTRVPNWTGSITNDIRYKGFDLNILVFARMGQWISSDYYAKFVRNGGDNSAVVDYWTPENPTNAYPRPNATRPFFSNSITTLTEREASYVKLRNVTLGYTLPKKLMGKAKIDALRLYVSGKNLHTFSSLKDFDPEGEGVIDRPLNRLFVFGLNLNF